MRVHVPDWSIVWIEVSVERFFLAFGKFLYRFFNVSPIDCRPFLLGQIKFCVGILLNALHEFGNRASHFCIRITVVTWNNGSLQSTPLARSPRLQDQSNDRSFFFPTSNVQNWVQQVVPYLPRHQRRERWQAGHDAQTLAGRMHTWSRSAFWQRLWKILRKYG